MDKAEFERQFEALTGPAPLSWQWRLFEEHFRTGNLPGVIDLPTGLGKTMIMAIWLIARLVNPCLPRRLVYVVDRRTVVDQATDLAMRLSERCKEALGTEPPAISTLRGQLADNREWSRDLSKPAIIIGTVDLIGSGLLFSGYRSSYKRRPLEAGLLGVDSLLVLDEAHLSTPFEKLLCSIGKFNKPCEADNLPVKPMCVIRMSATSSAESNADPFRLEGDFESQTGDFADDTVFDRYKAAKHLTILPLGEKDKLTDRLASEAIKLSADDSLRGKRIVVFVRKPDDAKAIAKAIKEHAIKSRDESGPKPKKLKHTPYADSVEVLTGTMRGLERDELVEKPVLKRFLDGDEDPNLENNKQPVFLISTSAGEVGFDLNADHMVCDATTIDSLIQRLGRVNRRGTGSATVVLVHAPPKMKDGKPVELKDLDLAITNTLKLLEGVTDVSPRCLLSLKSNEWKDKYNDACSPTPTTVELTDILLDAWSMTSIIEQMPGRPDVGPWLRGIAQSEPPQTEIAWRAELDLDGFSDLDLDEIEEWFDTHRVLRHETLSVKTSDAATWFQDRWNNLPESERRQLAKLSVVIDRAGMEITLLGDVVTRLLRKAADADAFLRGAAIVVPATFGGIRRGVGLLDPSEPKLDKDDEKNSPEEKRANLNARQGSIDVADAHGRYREKVEKPEEGAAVATPLDSNAVKPPRFARYALDLLSNDDATLRLVSYVPKLERLDWGTLRQYLHDYGGECGHVECVRRHANEIIKWIGLKSNDPVREALELAADWHDNGKDRDRWQRCAGWKPPEPALGKSGGTMKRDSRGYRHEFGSLREFTDAFNAGKLLDDTGKPISQDVFDLAMHLIATHHGRGRPHFPKGGFDPECETRSEEIHAASIRRFARLQRKYGWLRLAWLENLLRCADALASAEQNAEVKSDDLVGGNA